jgi:hypothetical protein
LVNSGKGSQMLHRKQSFFVYRRTMQSENAVKKSTAGAMLVVLDFFEIVE